MAVLPERRNGNGWTIKIATPIAAALLTVLSMWLLAWYREGDFSPNTLSRRLGTLEAGDKEFAREITAARADIKEIQGQIDQLSHDVLTQSRVNGDKLDKLLKRQR